MEWEQKGQVVISSKRSNVGILIVEEHVATALEDHPDSPDPPGRGLLG